MKILVTGTAGFIGFHLAKRLLGEGHQIIGIDNLNDYYSVDLKKARLEQLKKESSFEFYPISIENRTALEDVFQIHKFDRVLHLAAQAGVRYSLKNPHAYADSNLMGFLNVLECCRQQKSPHLVYASSSSVYGGNTKMPFTVGDSVDYPVSLYAATKRANELMAHSYSHLYDLPCTGLRFFTVYGPWGRPDMAYFDFTQAILEGKPISVFNNGKMKRDFTYIDDVVEGLVRTMDHFPKRDEKVFHSGPHKIYNIGHHSPVDLLRFIELIEEYTGSKAEKNFLPMQPGDVPATYADVSDLQKDVGYTPETSIETGLKLFVEWYKEWYKV